MTLKKRSSTSKHSFHGSFRRCKVRSGSLGWATNAYSLDMVVVASLSPVVIQLLFFSPPVWNPSSYPIKGGVLPPGQLILSPAREPWFPVLPRSLRFVESHFNVDQCAASMTRASFVPPYPIPCGYFLDGGHILCRSRD